MKTKWLAIAAVCGSAALVLGARSVHTEQTQPALVSPLKLARVVINSEVTLKLHKQPFNPLGGLVKAGTLQLRGSPSAADPKGMTEILVGGYYLRVAASPDGNHFQVAVVWPDARDCRPGYFSDERATIYEGLPLGCAGGTFRAPR